MSRILVKLSANTKVFLIIILGVGTSLVGFTIGEYFHNKDFTSHFVLQQIHKTIPKVENIRLMSRDFIQNATQEAWDNILKQTTSVKSILTVKPEYHEYWREEMKDIRSDLDAYYRLLEKMKAPAFKLSALKKALQGKGLELSREIEKKIIKPCRDKEGMLFYKGLPADPFQGRVKDTAYDLNALHIKQQLLLMELLLNENIEAYESQKSELSDSLLKHKTQLQYMSILTGSDPVMQEVISTLNEELSSLILTEQEILALFKELKNLNTRLGEVGEIVEKKTYDLSEQIIKDTEALHKLNQKFNWMYLSFIISCFCLLGAFLGRDILKFVKSLEEAKEEIKKSEEDLKLTLYSIGDAVIVTDEESVITRMNPSAEALTGWAADEAVGGKLSGVFNIINAFTRNTINDPVKNILNTGIIDNAEQINLISKDGKEYFIDTNGTPIRNQAHQIIGFILVFRDVTSSYNADQKIRQNEKRLKNITANAPGALFQVRIVSNVKYQILFMSEKASEILGFHFTNDTFFSIFLAHLPREDKSVFLSSIARATQRIATWNYEGRFIKDSGETIWFGAQAVPQIENERLIYYGVIMDITERKQSENENKRLELALRQAQKMEAIGTLAGGVAHDFNNILNAIMGFTEISLLKTSKDDPIYDNLEEVLTASLRASELVKQILTFSRHTQYEVEPIQLGSVAEEALKLLRSSIPKTIEITTNIPDGLNHIMADSTQIHQIIMNLCTNAAHAMEADGGKLNLELEGVELSPEDIHNYPSLKPGNYIKLTIQDTGIGISQENLEKIFDPYFTTKEKEKGTGLGLAVIHGIIRKYNGAIYVYSEVGVGTTFHVYLPAIKSEKTAEDSMKKDDLVKGNEAVLFVDDEPQLTRLGKIILENLGYRVQAFTDSLEALEQFRKTPDDFDLVISDMTMPNLTGDKLASLLLEIKKDLPIILCTGFNKNISEDLKHRIGIKALIMKPLVTKDLSLLIRKVLDER